jgi:hypothetical protein
MGMDALAKSVYYLAIPNRMFNLRNQFDWFGDKQCVVHRTRFRHDQWRAGHDSAGPNECVLPNGSAVISKPARGSRRNRTSLMPEGRKPKSKPCSLPTQGLHKSPRARCKGIAAKDKEARKDIKQVLKKWLPVRTP